MTFMVKHKWLSKYFENFQVLWWIYKRRKHRLQKNQELQSVLQLQKVFKVPVWGPGFPHLNINKFVKKTWIRRVTKLAANIKLLTVAWAKADWKVQTDLSID